MRGFRGFAVHKKTETGDGEPGGVDFEFECRLRHRVWEEECGARIHLQFIRLPVDFWGWALEELPCRIGKAADWGTDSGREDDSADEVDRKFPAFRKRGLKEK